MAIPPCKPGFPRANPGLPTPVLACLVAAATMFGPSFRRHIHRLIPVTLAFITAACIHRLPPPKAKPVLFEWQDAPQAGELAVKIDLSTQTATYHRGKTLVGWSFVSSGTKGHSTRPGSYTITEMMDVKFSDRYGWIADATGTVTNPDAKPTTPVPPGEIYSPAPMHCWMRLTSYGVGMHAGEIPHPGQAASHGCIRLPREFAPMLYQAVRIGTPVVIHNGKSP